MVAYGSDPWRQLQQHWQRRGVRVESEQRAVERELQHRVSRLQVTIKPDEQEAFS